MINHEFHVNMSLRFVKFSQKWVVLQHHPPLLAGSQVPEVPQKNWGNLWDGIWYAGYNSDKTCI